MQPRILTVSELTGSIRGLLESSFPFVAVRGEVSTLRQPASGHLYFLLKDTQAQIKVVLFKMQKRYLSRAPREGERVLLRGRLSLYEPRGEYQLLADTLEYEGSGDMRLAFELLKSKLAAEGLFDPERKKPLPHFPQHLTLITSPNGAAVHDFIHVAKNRFPLTRIAIFPVSVQGEKAAEEMRQAIMKLNAWGGTEILLLCRGGGSLEDLQAFNQEALVRTIAASSLPVVSAVGHEIDYTLADFAADLRAPTPSAAAEMLLPDQAAVRAILAGWSLRMRRGVRTLEQVLSTRLGAQQIRLSRLRHPVERFLLQVDFSRQLLQHLFFRGLEQRRGIVALLEKRLQSASPQHVLQKKQDVINALRSRLERAMTVTLRSGGARLESLAAILQTVSPLATLARGYAIVQTEDPKRTILTDAGQASVGDHLAVTLHKGVLRCRVLSSTTREDKADEVS